MEEKMLHKRIDIEINGNNTENCHPQLATYILDNYPSIDENRLRPAILICPGGGYEHTSDREAEAIAIQMMQWGSMPLYFTILVRQPLFFQGSS